MPDFESKQKIDDSTIKCDKCDQYNKANTYNNLFFRCLSCNSNLCPLCKSIHDKSHNIIDYDQINFVCNLHNEQYNAYCKNCKKDICLICEKEHTEHYKIFYDSIIPDKKDLEDGVNNLKKSIEKLKEKINIIIKKLNEIMKNMDAYNIIYNDIINNYNNKKRNYSTTKYFRYEEL